MSQHVISVQVENRSGVLSRVAGLFSARGYNIDSLSVSHTAQHDISVMTIVVQGDERIIEQVTKQLNKLIDVIKVSDHTGGNAIEREFILVRVSAKPAQRGEIIKLGEVYNADIAEISPKSITMGIMGEPEKINNIVELLRPYGIKELMRTGRTSMVRDFEGK
jgi:acetolactate synthase-1/3 small subunit